jgi:hypothetical protein
MPLCPLCSTRAAKRFCPAKTARICAVCCGEKREVEIYCPADCVYLKAGRDYESEKHPIDSELEVRSRYFDELWIQRFSHVLDLVSETIVEEWKGSEWLVDDDVIEVLKAVGKTLRTLSSGIYYESAPEGAIRQSLFRALKDRVDWMMQPQEGISESLKLKDAIDAIDFLTLAAQMNSSSRPKSRRYLDWISSIVKSTTSKQERHSGLILP